MKKAQQKSKGEKPVVAGVDPGKTETVEAVEVQDFGEGIDAVIAERICQHIEDTPRGLDYICAVNKGLVSARTFHRWLEKSLSLRQRYLRARARQAAALVDECLEIADDSTRDTKLVGRDGNETEVPDTEWISRSKLRIDTRMRMAGKLDPKKWGEKIEVENKGELTVKHKWGGG